MARSKGRVALAPATVKYFLFFCDSLLATVHLSCSGNSWQCTHQAGPGAGSDFGLGAGFSGGAGSGGLVHTGSACSLDAATAVGFRDIWPQATSNGSFAKSMIHPSRL